MMPPADFMAYVTPAVILIAQVAHAYWLKHRTTEALAQQTVDLKKTAAISIAVQTTELKTTADATATGIAEKLNVIHDQVNGNLDQMAKELAKARSDVDRLMRLLDSKTAKTKK